MGGGSGSLRRPKKDPPIEQALACTLEELYKGSVRRMKIRWVGGSTAAALLPRVGVGSRLPKFSVRQAAACLLHRSAAAVGPHTLGGVRCWACLTRPACPCCRRSAAGGAWTRRGTRVRSRRS